METCFKLLLKQSKILIELKSEQEWENLEHGKEYKKNFTRRKNISPKNVFQLLQKSEFNVDYNTGLSEKRKPYYIMPLGWENIAKSGGKVFRYWMWRWR